MYCIFEMFELGTTYMHVQKFDIEVDFCTVFNLTISSRIYLGPGLSQPHSYSYTTFFRTVLLNMVSTHAYCSFNLFHLFLDHSVYAIWRHSNIIIVKKFWKNELEKHLTCYRQCFKISSLITLCTLLIWLQFSKSSTQLHNRVQTVK